MRILHIRIENFGTISDFDLDCKEGLNALMHSNGWGKTTLAAFIRAMFYGLEGGRKRDYAVNDRMRYQPWNKGFFGGEITFEVGGKKYVLSRDFGSKDADATFALFDGVTGLPSRDYSENIGVELFGIDSESYRRTGFIDHNMIKYDGVNSTISSKVSTLSQTNDLNNFDKVDNDLKDYLNTHSPKKRTGTLYSLNEEIQMLNQECKKAGALNSQLDDLQNKKKAEHLKETELKAKRDEVLSAQRALGEKKSKITVLQALHRLHEETLERENARKEALMLFGGSLPDREAPKKLSKLAAEAMNRKSALDQTIEGVDNSRYDRLTRYFKDNAPSEEEVQKAIDDFSKVRELIKLNDSRSTEIESGQKTAENLRRSVLSLGREKEEKSRQREEILNAINRQKREMEEAGARFERERRAYEEEAEAFNRKQKEYNDECRRIEELRAQLGAKKSVSMGTLIPGIIAIVIGIVVAIICLTLHVTPVLYAVAGVLIVLGIVLIILSFAGKKKKISLPEFPKAPSGSAPTPPTIPEILQSAPFLQVPEETARFDEEIAKTKEQEEKCLAGIQGLREEIEADERKITLLENDIRVFLDRFAISYSRSDAQDVLYEMKSRVGEYKEVKAAKQSKEEDIEKLKAGVSAADEALKEALKEFNKDFNGYESAQKFAGDLSLMIAAFDATESEYKQARLKEETYREENAEVASLYDARGTEMLNVEENEEERFNALTDELKSINEVLDDKAALIASYNRSIDEIYRQIEDVEEKKEERDTKQESYDEDYKRYELIGKTKIYLGKSKERFIARFMSPIKDSFDKYYRIMAASDGVGAEFRVDAQMNFTKKEDGTFREIQTQSEGYSDMIGICIRFALLDVMYKSERPVVIMDDPFVNLDEEHLSSAKEFLKKVSGDYQIIYCTCHKDRALD